MQSKKFNHALDGLICSDSGWRKKFVLNDGHLQDYDALFFYYAIKSFVILEAEKYILNKKQHTQAKQTSVVSYAIAQDTRAASYELAEIAAYALQNSDMPFHANAQYKSLMSEVTYKIKNIGIVPITAALAFTKKYADALIFITASHNPKEYSGIKFCQGDGRILAPKENKKLISVCKRTAKKFLDDTISNEQLSFLHYVRKRTKQTTSIKNKKYIHARLHNNTMTTTITKTYIETLEQSVLRGIAQTSATIRKKFLQKIQANTEQYAKVPTLVWDVNGGTRSWTGDNSIYTYYGITLLQLNTEAGMFAHEIVPEGKALKQASQILHTYNSPHNNNTPLHNILFAVVCDCDGDRGNIILYDVIKKKSITLSAQEVFSLVLKIELAWEMYIRKEKTVSPVEYQFKKHSNKQPSLAVVVNDASSLRIDAIASEYGVPVFRSEVGEANVLALGDELRKKKYLVPLSGEASNGGIIMYPSFVRDPLHMSFSLLKAIFYFHALFPSFHNKSTKNISSKQPVHNPLITLVKHFPKAASTSTEAPLAKLTIPAISMSKLFYIIQSKRNILHKQTASLFKTKGIIIDDYKIICHTGKKASIIDATTISKHNTLKGGLSIYFYPKKEKQFMRKSANQTIEKISEETTKGAIAMLWLRKSSTEPLVRIIADVLGTHATYFERKLITLWRTFLLNILKDHYNE